MTRGDTIHIRKVSNGYIVDTDPGMHRGKTTVCTCLLDVFHALVEFYLESYMGERKRLVAMLEGEEGKGE